MLLNESGVQMSMYIRKLIVKNYRVLKEVNIDFNDHLNIIVGDNECGKSTLMEVINLVLSGQLNGRSIQYELHPFLFNLESVEKYVQALKDGNPEEPPKILIEVYLNNNSGLARLKGTNNSMRENTPGISLSIEFDEIYKAEYVEYIKSPEKIRTVPIEYYTVKWFSFAFNSVTSRSIPLKPTLIDASTIRHNTGATKYVLDIMKDCLTREQQVGLSLSYRRMKDLFLEDEDVKNVNKQLSSKNDISQKNLTVSLDTTSKSGWESGIMPQLDAIPLPLIGKGEQSSIKIKLSMDIYSDAHIFLIEEPENHLSHANLNKLIKKVSDQSSGKQLIITTHSSFVLNKLGIENVLLFAMNKCITLKDLSKDTYSYFMKLPGHDTLRLILAKKAILVEGPSDELVVHKAFLKMHGCMPLERNVDVISVNSLAFKRFLEIASLLGIEIRVITDNDSNVKNLQEKYQEYANKENIKICYDSDIQYPTLEPQLLKVNDLHKLNKILEKVFDTDERLLTYMGNNKTDCALKIFDTDIDINIPSYINEAISE
jgi:putative ATP-dependent endonuclease of OLD family